MVVSLCNFFFDSQKWSEVKVAQSCPTLCNPMDYTVHGILQARILEWVAFPLSRVSSQPRSPALQVDSLPAEPPGNPKNTGVGSLSLFQQSFPTQEWNQSLLHCRWILYQLFYQGSPWFSEVSLNFFLGFLLFYGLHSLIFRLSLSNVVTTLEMSLSPIWDVKYSLVWKKQNNTLIIFIDYC